MKKTETVWAFDLGKGSIGEAVRQGTKFLHKASLLIPADFAETKTAAGRRRMWRTRQAHKAREHWLNEVMREAGIEVLHGRNYDQAGNWKPGEPADERLEREFAEPGDTTCYTSCLLRMKLLRGEKLESWQIHKALHSAIQRRGYLNCLWGEGKTLSNLYLREVLFYLNCLWGEGKTVKEVPAAAGNRGGDSPPPLGHLAIQKPPLQTLACRIARAGGTTNPCQNNRLSKPSSATRRLCLN